jgi:hypothetical protein
LALTVCLIDAGSVLDTLHVNATSCGCPLRNPIRRKTQEVRFNPMKAPRKVTSGKKTMTLSTSDGSVTCSVSGGRKVCSTGSVLYSCTCSYVEEPVKYDCPTGCFEYEEDGGRHSEVLEQDLSNGNKFSSQKYDEKARRYEHDLGMYFPTLTVQAVEDQAFIDTEISL